MHVADRLPITHRGGKARMRVADGLPYNRTRFVPDSVKRFLFSGSFK